jgi:hypothetical protein
MWLPARAYGELLEKIGDLKAEVAHWKAAYDTVCAMQAQALTGVPLTPPKVSEESVRFDQGDPFAFDPAEYARLAKAMEHDPIGTLVSEGMGEQRMVPEPKS